MENTREIAATTLYAITEDGAYANLTLGNALRFGPTRQILCNELGLWNTGTSLSH